MHAMNNSTAYFARAVSYARKKVRKSTQKINITFFQPLFEKINCQNSKQDNELEENFLSNDIRSIMTFCQL